jgi:hypothetical protein
MCPCCHNFLKKDLRSRNVRRRSYQQKYYIKNREKKLAQQRIRDAEKRALKKQMNELITVQV